MTSYRGETSSWRAAVPIGRQAAGDRLAVGSEDVGGASQEDMLQAVDRIGDVDLSIAVAIEDGLVPRSVDPPLAGGFFRIPGEEMTEELDGIGQLHGSVPVEVAGAEKDRPDDE